MYCIIHVLRCGMRDGQIHCVLNICSCIVFGLFSVLFIFFVLLFYVYNTICSRPHMLIDQFIRACQLSINQERKWLTI